MEPRLSIEGVSDLRDKKEKSKQVKLNAQKGST